MTACSSAAAASIADSALPTFRIVPYAALTSKAEHQRLNCKVGPLPSAILSNKAALFQPGAYIQRVLLPHELLPHVLLRAGTVDQYISAHAGTQNLFDIGKTDTHVKVMLPSAFIVYSSAAIHLVRCLLSRVLSVPVPCNTG